MVISYLENRKQLVTVNGYIDEKHIEFGVPTTGECVGAGFFVLPISGIGHGMATSGPVSFYPSWTVFRHFYHQKFHYNLFQM